MSESTGTLQIGRIDRRAGCCTGKEEVFLLCEKVNKDDVAVRFYQLENGIVSWEAYGDFGPLDVHKEYAIVFQTPAYRDVDIQRPVDVFMQLRRIKSDETSNSITFTYHPQNLDRDEIERKRRKTIFGSSSSYSDFSAIAEICFNEDRRDLVPETSASSPQMMIDVTADNAMSDETLLSEYSASQSVDDDNVGEMVNRSGGDSADKQGSENKELIGHCVGLAMDGAQGMSAPMHERAIRTGNTRPMTESSQQDAKPPSVMTRIEALQNYACTGNAMFILKQDSHLLSVADRDGDTVVHLAIINKKIEALASIIDAQPFAGLLNQCNKLKQTPLHLATLTNQPEMLDLLLGKVDVSLVDRHGDTCFHIASRYGYEQCLRKLLHAAKPNEIAQILKILNFKGISAIHEAVISGHVKLLELLLTSGGDVNLPDGRSGRTPLHYATEIDNRSAVELLVLQDLLNVDAVTFNGDTALHLAAGRSCVHVAALLVIAGADPFAQNCQKANATGTGQTPRDLATGNQQMLRILRGDPYSSVIATSEPTICYARYT